jgi:hypothetical protein
MTHTLFRHGGREDLREDFVLLAMCATGITHQGSASVKKKLYEILQRFPHANSGDVKTGSEFNAEPEAIRNGFVDTSVFHYVFTDKETVVQVLEEIRKANLGISIVLTGLLDEVEDCCRSAGIRPHTVEHSAGVMGRTERLPDEQILGITTMCGHGLVAANLVLEMVKRIRRGKLSIEKAAAKLAGPCICGVFNPKRAERLLSELV